MKQVPLLLSRMSFVSVTILCVAVFILGYKKLSGFVTIRFFITN